MTPARNIVLSAFNTELNTIQASITMLARDSLAWPADSYVRDFLFCGTWNIHLQVNPITIRNGAEVQAILVKILRSYVESSSVNSINVAKIPANR